MSPRSDQDQDFLAKESEVTEVSIAEKPKEKQIVWRNVVLFVFLHIGSIVGAYYFAFEAKWATVLWTILLYYMAAFGITMGAHRLWSHKTYKATTPLRALLVFCNCISFQNDVIEWARDHRGHHKWSETTADPHDASRGLFFSHMGWLLVRKHPEVIRRGKTIDLSDLYAEKMLVFQRRYYPYLVVLLCFLMPTVIPVYLWGEKVGVAFFVCALSRYCCNLHVTWCVNSVAHTWGSKPYDKNISSVQNLWTSLSAVGEGFHNYHHTFPQDYRASEFPWLWNPSTFLIDFFSSIGWAYDKKAVTQQRIDKQKRLHGE